MAGKKFSAALLTLSILMIEVNEITKSYGSGGSRFQVLKGINLKIAKNFWVFGISVFWGALIGFGGAFLIMPSFYRVQNKNNILPEISVQFHWMLFFYLVILPTAAFVVIYETVMRIYSKRIKTISIKEIMVE